MAEHPLIIELFIRWQEARDGGGPLTPEELCRDHPECLPGLRRRVEEFERLAGLFDEGNTLPGAGDAGRPAPAYPEIPDYEILEEVGGGGMGVVYLARYRELNQLRAVKVIRSGSLPGPGQLRRFEREAQVLAHLEHDNIVIVHQARLHQGQPHFVMPLVRGGSLEERLDEYRHRPAAAAELIRRVAVAIDYAHQHGVIHRDLKPANILIGEGGKPLVSDFGIAMLLHARWEEEEAEDEPDPADAARTMTRITRDGSQMGTLPFMAPEQVRAELDRIDARSDVWALGVILYRLLTGQRPFRADNPSELARRIAEANPVPPRRHPAEVDGTLSNIVMKCLQADPDQRYQSAGALAEALQAWQDRRPVGVETWRRRLGRQFARWRVPAAGALAVVAALALAKVTGIFHPADGRPVTLTEAEYLRVAEEYQRRLQREESVTLIGAEVPGPAYRVRFGEGKAAPVSGRGAKHGVTFDAAGPAFLELLPGVPLENYRIVAEVRHDAERGTEPSIGLAWAYSEYPSEAGQERLFLSESFADLGVKAGDFRDHNGDRRALVHGWTIGDDPNRLFRSGCSRITMPGAGPPPGPLDLGETTFRTLRVEIQKPQMRVCWGEDGDPFETLTAGRQARELTKIRTALTGVPGLDLEELKFATDGAIGIFSLDSALTVRRFVIEPIAAAAGG